jgi:hypothetical protein
MKRAVLGLVAALLVAGGLALATLPQDWIEARVGVEPDAGSGVLELLLAIVPILAGLAIAVALYVSRPGVRTVSTSQGADRTYRG